MRPLSLKPQLDLKAFAGKSPLSPHPTKQALCNDNFCCTYTYLQYFISSGFDFAHWLVEISKVTFKATGAQFYSETSSKNV